MTDVLVIGAGVAGLACASALRDAGATVTVVDKGRGVGGRCATRRVEGQPVDHGVCFLHGVDSDFLAALDAVDAPRIPGWPRVVYGRGAPCHPSAFEPSARRLAFPEGVNVFPKHLARGLDVRLNARVVGLTVGDGVATATTEDGLALSGRALVLALPAEQAAALLEPLPTLATARALLGAVVTHPCWTVIARYAGSDEPLDAEIFYPETGALQLLVHDSAKRVGTRVRTLVLQARPSWTARHLDTPPEEVVAALLEDAAGLLGPWAGAPNGKMTHRWRYARMDRGTGLATPYLVALPGGARIGLAGEGFDPAGGVEAAWRSGRRLAHRIAFGGANGE